METKNSKLYRVSFVTMLVLSLCLTINLNTTQAAPNAKRLTNMPTFAQNYRLSCEYAATIIALKYWGFNMSERDFINNIPTNPDPHVGFRGYINGEWGWINDYGIYPEPIAKFLNSRGINTKLLWGGVAALKEEINLGRPVVVWVTAGMLYSDLYINEYNNQKFFLMPYEHAVTIYGYDENGVMASDPGMGTYEYYSWASFQRSWGYLRNMAMSIWPNDQSQTQNERGGIAPEFYRHWLLHGNVEMLGQPISAAFVTGGKTIQYFERVRLEYDNSLGASQPIIHGLLGREMTSLRTHEAAFQPLNPQEVATDKIFPYFAETGQRLAPQFANYWQQYGSISMFGYPISRPFYENGLLVQYFERSRLELHNEGTTKVFIQAGLLGSERVSIQM